MTAPRFADGPISREGRDAAFRRSDQSARARAVASACPTRTVTSTSLPLDHVAPDDAARWPTAHLRGRGLAVGRAGQRRGIGRRPALGPDRPRPPRGGRAATRRTRRPRPARRATSGRGLPSIAHRRRPDRDRSAHRDRLDPRSGGRLQDAGPANAGAGQAGDRRRARRRVAGGAAMAAIGRSARRPGAPGRPRRPSDRRPSS